MPRTNIINQIGKEVFMNLDWNCPLDRAKPTARGTKSIKMIKNPINANSPIVTFTPDKIAKSELT